MSQLWNLHWKDLVKGLVVSVLTSVLTLLAQEVQAGAIDWKTIGTVAMCSCLGYLAKQLATDEDGKLGGKF